MLFRKLLILGVFISALASVSHAGIMNGDFSTPGLSGWAVAGDVFDEPGRAVLPEIMSPTFDPGFGPLSGLSQIIHIPAAWTHIQFDFWAEYSGAGAAAIPSPPGPPPAVSLPTVPGGSVTPNPSFGVDVFSAYLLDAGGVASLLPANPAPFGLMDFLQFVPAPGGGFPLGIIAFDPGSISMTGHPYAPGGARVRVDLSTLTLPTDAILGFNNYHAADSSGFAVYVDNVVPLPGALVMGILGMGTAGLVRRNRRRSHLQS